MTQNSTVAELIQASDETTLINRAKDQPREFSDRHWFAAIKTGRLDICKTLVAAGVTPMKTRFDRTPLHFAADFHKVDIIKWLLELGADPNRQDSDSECDCQ